MAETKAVKKEAINLDEQVTVSNIAGWNVGFARILGIGDVTITPEGKTRLSRNEIISQAQNGNKLFTGVDGKGSHATLFIDDAPTRIEVGFESEDGKEKQEIFSDKTVSDLFEVKAISTFEKKLSQVIRTRAEKFAVIQAIKRLGINDYSKLRLTENYTGYKIQ